MLVACGAPNLTSASTGAVTEPQLMQALAGGALDGGAGALEHAADHARVAASARARRTPVESTQTRQAARTAQLAVNAAEVPAQDGQWEPPFAIPAIGIHATMLATGKVLWFYRTSSDNERGKATLWDPATSTFTQVPPPLINGKPANIFCAGQSSLPDGRIVVMGGQVGPNPGTNQQYKGLNTVFTFNPFDETWTRQPDMRDGRWYPTQVLTPDGRTIVMSGLDASGVVGAPRNPDIELFTPSVDLNGVGTVTRVGHRGGAGEPPDGGLYPHMFTMPSGRTFVAGPRAQDSWFLDPLSSGAMTWSQAPDPASHSYGTGVILPNQTPGAGTKVALIAGGSSPAGTLTEVFDEAAPGGGWVTSAPLNVPRSHHNTVLLPDASMVTLGGGGNIGGDKTQFTADHLAVELYDPSTQSWRRGPSQQEGRAYHSTALLLPDGRVVSAGDDTAGGSLTDTAELYSPPYLFKGARPAIESAPATVGFGRTFSVGFSGSDVARAVLIAPGATTHANDMSQRFVPLSVSAGAPGSVTLTAPANASLAPPSHYMLFLVNAEGVPSVAKFLRLGGGAVDPEPGAAARLSATPSSAALGSVAVGATRQVAVTISNTGDAPASVSAVTVGGADAGQFSAPGGGFALAAGASRELSVAFSPTSAGAKSGVMSVEYGSAAPSPLTVALSGTGEPPPAATRTVSVSALADTGLDQNAPAVANGSAGEIRVDYQLGADTTSALQAYVKFDVPPLAAGETITAAALGLQVSDESPNGPHVYRTGTAWAESSLTWNARTALATASPPGAAPISATAAGNAGSLPVGRRTIALSGVTTAGLHSFEVRAVNGGPEADSGSDLIFASREHPIAASRPTLELTISSQATTPDTTPPPQPTVSPASGTYSGAQQVSMSVAEGGAVIRYTAAAGVAVPEDPTATTGTQYTAAFSVGTSQVIKAAAFDAAGNRSPIAQRDYTINAGPPPPPPPPPPPGTRTVSVAALADTGLDQNAPAVANGSAGEIRVDYQLGADTTSALQAYVKFDVPPLAAGETITAAALGLQVSDESPNGPHVYRTGTAWAESSLTWNARSALATASPPGAAPISTTPAGNAGNLPVGRRTIALSGVTAAGLHSFEIRALPTGTEADSGSDIIFASRQHPIAASRPTLELTITTP